jgi:hypothetical protein
VRVLEIRPHRFSDFVLAQLQDAGRAALDDGHGLLPRIFASDAFSPLRKMWSFVMNIT